MEEDTLLIHTLPLRTGNIMQLWEWMAGTISNLGPPKSLCLAENLEWEIRYLVKEDSLGMTWVNWDQMECNMANPLRSLQGWSLWSLNNSKANISFIFQNGSIILKGEIKNYRRVTFTSAPINKLWRKSSKKTCPGVEIWKQIVLPWWTLISDKWYINEKMYLPPFLL